MSQELGTKWNVNRLDGERPTNVEPIKKEKNSVNICQYFRQERAPRVPLL